MSIDVTQLVVLKYHIEELEKEISRKNEKLHYMRDELQKKCTHPTIKTERNYHEGGYDYVSSVDIVKTCTLCDKVIEFYKDPKHKGYHA